MPADPLTSDGARRERRAWREKIRRLQKVWLPAVLTSASSQAVKDTLRELEEFGEKRQARYDRAAGGLGKK